MIRLVEQADPLTEASWQNPPVLADSEAFRTLLREIQRYANRETAGRSFLIAGHRGSGKTTAVRFAVQAAQHEAREGRLKLWPMLIALHGPDILDAENADRPRPVSKPKLQAPSTDPKKDGEAADAKADPKAKEQGDKPEPGKPTDAQKPPDATKPPDPSPAGSGNSAAAALRILAKCLHRALADELAGGFRRHIQSIATDAPAARDLLELAAHVEQELDHAVSVAALRDCWRRASALETGVLAAGRGEWGRSLRSGQGTRELVALATAAEAFKIVAGNLSLSDSLNTEGSRENSTQFGSKLVGSDLFNPLVGAVTGGALGATALATNPQSPWIAALLGVGSAVAANLTLNYTSNRTQKTDSKSQRQIVWDTSIASLDRMLPVLIDRMLSAGLAPIFAIDELDKVKDLDPVMEDLITHLKHFVTEKAFFCFICDRAYFERITASGRSGSYSREYTFFSDRLFVQYTPADLKLYLKQILIADPPASTDTEKSDLEFLPNLLLQSARLSPIGLHRELRRFTETDGHFRLEPGDVRIQQGFQMRAFMQLAIEFMFGERRDKTIEPPVRKRMKQDYLFARLAGDALYYPAVEWAKGEPTLDVSKRTFERYLKNRLAGDPNDSPPASAAAGSNPRHKARPLEIPEIDSDFLYEIFRELMRYLKTPAELFPFIDVTAAGISVDLIKPFVEGDDNDLHWRWLYDQYGREIAKPAAAPAPPPPPRQPKPASSGPASTHPPLKIAPELSVRQAFTDPNIPVFHLVDPAPAPLAAATKKADETAPKSSVDSPAVIQPEDALAVSRKNAEWIESIEQSLRGFGAEVTPSTLGQKLAILDPALPWDNVATSIRRLIAPRSRAADLQDDIRLVDAYAKMLRDSDSILRDSMILAVAAGQPVDRSPSASVDIAAGLRLVSSLFSFGSLPRLQSGRMLASVALQLFNEMVSAQLEPYSEEADLGVWLRDLRDRLFRPKGELLASYGQKRLTNGSFPRGGWTAFFETNSFGFESIYTPDLDDFTIASMGAPHLFAFVDKMTLGQLSALSDLGDKALQSAIRAFCGAGSNLLARQQRSGERVLVVFDNISSRVATTWTPSAKHSVWCERAHLVSDLQVPDFPADWKPTMIMVENADLIGSKEFPGWFNSSYAPSHGGPIVILIPSLTRAVTQSSSGTSSSSSFSPFPPSLDEAVERANSLFKTKSLK